MTPAALTTRRTAAFSLLEMVLSLTVLAIVFAAVGSVFVLAAKVIPAPGSALASGTEQSRALSRLVEDLETAKFITEHSANSVTMVLDDRTGDGLPDRYRYAWSGKPGAPLTLSINGTAPVTVGEDVQHFVISLGTTPETFSVPATTTTSNEQALYSRITPTEDKHETIDDKHSVGQLIFPSLPPEAISYRITHVRYRARTKENDHTGQAYVRLRGVSGQLPDTSVLCEELVLESDLGEEFQWVTTTFRAPVDRVAGEATALTFEWNGVGADPDDKPMDIEYDGKGQAGWLTRSDIDQPWEYDDEDSMVVEVYGTYIVRNPGVSLTQQVYTEAKIDLGVGDAIAQSVTTALLREPGVHSAVWDAEFDAAPMGIDLDGDGADWATKSGGSAGAFSQGLWSVDGVLCSNGTHAFSEPTVVDLVMGSSAASRGGAVFRINADQSGGQAVPLILRVGQDKMGEHCVRVFDSENQGTIRLEVTELGTNLPRIRLLIAPGDNAVGLIVNGIPAGSFVYETVSSGGLPGVAGLSEAADGVFDSVTIRVGGSASVTLSETPPGDAGAAQAQNDAEGGGGLLNNLLGR